MPSTKHGQLPLASMPERPSTGRSDSRTRAGSGRCRHYSGSGQRSDRKDPLQLPGYKDQRETLGYTWHLERCALYGKQKRAYVRLLVRQSTFLANAIWQPDTTDTIAFSEYDARSFPYSQPREGTGK